VGIGLRARQIADAGTRRSLRPLLFAVSATFREQFKRAL
jgi:hypothetical protein